MITHRKLAASLLEPPLVMAHYNSSLNCLLSSPRRQPGETDAE
jgi:hypothetical protein